MMGKHDSISCNDGGDYSNTWNHTGVIELTQLVETMWKRFAFITSSHVSPIPAIFILGVATCIPFEINHFKFFRQILHIIHSLSLMLGYPPAWDLQVASNWRDDIVTEIFLSFTKQAFPDWDLQVGFQAACGCQINHIHSQACGPSSLHKH